MKLTANFKAWRGGSSRTMYMGEKEDEFVPVSEKQGQQKSRLNDFKSKARSSSSCTGIDSLSLY